MNTPEKELSESLLAACKAAGIEKPKYIAQDEDGKVWHYESKPCKRSRLNVWDNTRGEILNHPPYAGDWKESLLEWVEPQEKAEHVWSNWMIEPQGEPLADVLARHPESFTIETEISDEGEVTAHFIRNHRNEITEMIRPDHVADTSKKVDDACKVAYHAHLEKGDGLCWSRADCYRAAWQDALEWKAGNDD